MPTVYTYRFPTHWTTTSDELTGYIERFIVPPEVLPYIENGELPDVALHIEDPYIPPEPEPEPIPEEPIE